MTVTFTCNDALSGIASCTAPRHVTTEGADQPVTGTGDRQRGQHRNRSRDGQHRQDQAHHLGRARPRAERQRLVQRRRRRLVHLRRLALGCGLLLAVAASRRGRETSPRPAPSPTRPATPRASPRAVSTSTRPRPSITGTPTTSPNGNGWYKGDVTIHWTCSDALSGVVACPEDTVIAGERRRTDRHRVGHRPRRQHDRRHQPRGQHRPRRTGDDVRRARGLAAHRRDRPLQRDRRRLGHEDDVLLGRRRPAQTGHERHDHQRGPHRHRVLERGHGRQRRAEAHRRGVHRQGPAHDRPLAVAGARTARAGTTATSRCRSPVPTHVSDIESCSARRRSPTRARTRPSSGTAIDNAGNSAFDSATVSIDKSAAHGRGRGRPRAERARLVQGRRDRRLQLRRRGLRRRHVPDRAGPRSKARTRQATGTTVDNADNEASASLDGIDVDKTLPTISGAPTSAANDDGWHRDDVVIDWSCADDLSGLDGDCPANSTITGEGDSALGLGQHRRQGGQRPQSERLTA